MNLHAELRMRVHTHIPIQTHNSTRKNTLPDWLCGRLLVCVCVCVCACVYLHTLNAAYILPEQALYKPKSAQYTLKKALYTPKSALYTFKKALYTPGSALYTLKKALYTPKSALYTLKKALHTFLQPIRASCFSTFSATGDACCRCYATKWSFWMPLVTFECNLWPATYFRSVPKGLKHLSQRALNICPKGP